MPKRSSSKFFDPRDGDPAMTLRTFSTGIEPFEPERTNCFSVYWIEAGAGTFWADAGEHEFQPFHLLFFVPYQYIRLVPQFPVSGAVLQFHANFLCVETFHADVGCSGTLFNDPYGIPFVQLGDSTNSEVRSEVVGLLERMQREQREEKLAFQEVLLAYLKVLLIVVTRSKSSSPHACSIDSGDLRNPLLAQLKDLIEAHYREWHAPADYAAALHMTPKTLGRFVREHLGKTLTDLIQARILIHAKWQLLHTLRPVKEIAREVGFSDELYFSRLFKKATGVSPRYFREFETEIRGGRNLSMFSADAPIQTDSTSPDNSGVPSGKPE